MITINGKDELEEFIWKSSQNGKTILLYFGAKWCGPCQLLKDKLNSDESKQELPNLEIGYIDIDNEEEITEMYQVKSLPTQLFIALKQNKIKILKKIIGYDPSNLKITYDNLNNKDINNNVAFDKDFLDRFDTNTE